MTAPDLVVTVPAPCGWLNSNQRLHRMAVVKLTRAWRHAALLAAAGAPRFTDPVRIAAGARLTLRDVAPGARVRALVAGIDLVADADGSLPLPELDLFEVLVIGPQ